MLPTYSIVHAFLLLLAAYFMYMYVNAKEILECSDSEARKQMLKPFFKILLYGNPVLALLSLGCVAYLVFCVR